MGTKGIGVPIAKAQACVGPADPGSNLNLSTYHHFGDLVKAMVFPVVMYGCESWTIRKAEGQRIDAFELWCWRSLLSGVRNAEEA